MRNLDLALDLLAAGIPVAAVDSTGAVKAPATMDRRTICALFNDPRMIPSAVAGNGLTVFRFHGDEPYRRTVEGIRVQDRTLFDRLAVLRTPSARWEVLFCVQGGASPAGEVFARCKDGKPLVEILGAGDLVLFGGPDAPLWKQGNTKSIPTLPGGAMGLLLTVARAVNEAPEDEPEHVVEAVTNDATPCAAPEPMQGEAPQAAARRAVPDLDLFERQAKSWSVIPLIKGQKRPQETGWERHCKTKRPFRRADFRDRNAGIACGPASGVLVLDLDDLDAFNVLAEAHRLEIPDTYTVRTGSGKPHFYFQYPDDGREYGNMTVKHPLRSKHTVFDMRGLGGQVVAAGSIHPDTGRPYVIERHIAVAPAPAWIIKLYNEGK